MQSVRSYALHLPSLFVYVSTRASRLMSCSVHDTRPSTLDRLNRRPASGASGAAALLADAGTITTDPPPSSDTGLPPPPDRVEPAVITEASELVSLCTFTLQPPLAPL